MRHLILCREYPPAPSGGIGTYVANITRLLAEAGETVHVIGQLWKGAETTREEKCHGRLIIHRVPCEDRQLVFGPRVHPALRSPVARRLYGRDFPLQCFAWLAGAVAERLVEAEGIDVIEAQEYEAPLYYFQVRRALGLGPQRRPPCIVHLHSPTEFIAHHNEWDLSLSRWQMIRDLERYSILSADVLLCPSQYLSQQVAAHYRGQTPRIEIIPYPLGEMETVERQSEVWRTGSICYVGRLEKRKGVMEWIAAAVAVADQHPQVRFEFVGANVLGANLVLSEEVLRQLVPHRLQARFIFHGAVNRARIPQLLKRARIAVVPSRWENFPNTCMEAMASGLPVIASAEGGMKEMLSDGHCGWIAETQDRSGLQKALIRALETPALQLAEMGAAAAQRIRQVCHNQQILEHHLRLRRTIMQQEGNPAVHTPALRGGERPLTDEHLRREVLSDYPMNGVWTAHENDSQLKGHDNLDSFVELVADNAAYVRELATYAQAIRSRQKESRWPEPLAILHSLLRRPNLMGRVLRQMVAKL